MLMSVSLQILLHVYYSCSWHFPRFLCSLYTIDSSVAEEASFGERTIECHHARTGRCGFQSREISTTSSQTAAVRLLLRDAHGQPRELSVMIGT